MPMICVRLVRCGDRSGGACDPGVRFYVAGVGQLWLTAWIRTLQRGLSDAVFPWQRIEEEPTAPASDARFTKSFPLGDAVWLGRFAPAAGSG